MPDQNQITEKESIEIITSMIQKSKGSFHETGIGPILWGAVVSFASFVSFLQMKYGFSIGFDVWLLVLFAIIPQIMISVREKRSGGVKKYEDDALDTVWLVFGISLFCLIVYRNAIPSVTTRLIADEGWQMMKHYTDGSKPDEPLTPFVPSFYSIYIMLYAFPTLVTGLVKKYKPMTYGALLSYCLFVISCFTTSWNDMLLGAIAAMVCWLIPGILLRRKYLAQKNANVNV
ncbi:MAG: hypothetical protein IM587_02015 [Chitinophagaceae bacterium]|nr:hypothetical protein [Chitinophagaceae bacterium]